VRLGECWIGGAEYKTKKGGEPVCHTFEVVEVRGWGFDRLKKTEKTIAKTGEMARTCRGCLIYLHEITGEGNGGSLGRKVKKRGQEVGGGGGGRQEVGNSG